MSNRILDALDTFGDGLSRVWNDNCAPMFAATDSQHLTPIGNPPENNIHCISLSSIASPYVCSLFVLGVGWGNMSHVLLTRDQVIAYLHMYVDDTSHTSPEFVQSITNINKYISETMLIDVKT